MKSLIVALCLFASIIAKGQDTLWVCPNETFTIAISDSGLGTPYFTEFGINNVASPVLVMFLEVAPDTAGSGGGWDTIGEYEYGVAGHSYPAASIVATAAMDGWHFRGMVNYTPLNMLTLRVYPSAPTILNPVLCSGQVFYTHENNDTNSFFPINYTTTITNVYTSMHGCDSTVIANITVLAPDTFSRTVYDSLAVTGLSVDTLHNAGSNGCDSIIYTRTINPTGITELPYNDTPIQINYYDLLGQPIRRTTNEVMIEERIYRNGSPKYSKIYIY